MNPKAFLSSFSEGLGNLKSNRQRSLLGLLGIIIGTASVIMLINIAGIVEHQILQEFKSMGTNVFTVNTETYKESAQGFNPEHISKLKKEIPGLISLVPFQSLNSDVSFSGKSENDYYGVVATNSELFRLLRIEPSQGRLLTDFDTYESYVVAGNNLMKKSHLGLGSILRIEQSGFSIIGITKKMDDNMLLPFTPDDTVFISIKNARSLSKNFKISSLLGATADDSMVEKVSGKLKNRLQGLYPGQNIFIHTAKTIIDQAKKQADLLTILLAAIGSIALVVGGIGVMNVMLVSVAQRKTEIGLRIALGATAADIKMLFLSEAITLCFIGGILGTILGISISVIFALEMNMPFIVTWIAIPTGILISVISGILSGVYPATQAAKLNPIEALKTE